MISISQITDFVRKKAKPGSKLLLQLPEGLKIRAIEIMQSLENVGYFVILSNDPCYGACDIRDREAQIAGCNFIVHVGHKNFYREFQKRVPVIYIPLTIEATYDKKELSKIREPLVGMLSTVNYSYLMESFAKDLRAIDKNPVMGGEILGCNSDAARAIEHKVNCFLFIGTGKFHPSGLRTKLPVYIYDLERNKIEYVESKEFEKVHRINCAKIEKFREAKTVGILISSKQGQFYSEYEILRKRIEKTGKKVFVMIMDAITNERLMGLKIDFFINTACPRIAEDKFDKTVMNARDFLEFYC